MDSAAVAAGVGHGLLGYNRKNFMYDRKMRQKQEFQIADFRMEQANLWREDVRDLVELVSAKMETYTVVGVLFLIVSVEILAAGRLEPGTPQWLVWLYVLSVCGAVSYQMLTVWLANQASIAAQAYGARLLTQMVRLPVPSWEQMEAMRTYGKSWEALGPTKLFRIPFLGSLIKAFRGKCSSKEEHQKEPHDPWNLERSGQDIYELKQLPVSSLRHIKLVESASVNWQCFEGFTRVAMTMGATELLYACAYYSVGYMLVEDGEAVTTLLISILFGFGVALILWLDLSQYRHEELSTWVLSFAAPVGAAVAGYFWCQYTRDSHRRSLYVMMFVFAAHAASLLHLLALASDQRRRINGTTLPLRWRTVLYVDVFGWVAKQRRPMGDSFMKMLRKWRACRAGARGAYQAVARGSHDRYVPSHRPHAFTEDDTSDEDVVKEDWEAEEQRLEAGLRQHEQRLLATDAGHKAKDCVPDAAEAPPEPLRGVGSPGVVPPACGRAFDSQTFLPPDGLNHADRDDEALLKGEAPWLVFRFVTLVLSGLYAAGALWSISLLAGFVGLRLNPLPIIQDLEVSSDSSGPVGALITGAGLALDMGGEVSAESWIAEGPEVGPELPRLPDGQAVETIWPYSRNFAPRALSCDANGRRFVVADDFGIYTANLTLEVEDDYDRRESDELHARRRERFRARFQRAPPCPQLDGRMPRDADMICSRDPRRPNEDESCSALVLHEVGDRAAITECPLNLGRNVGSSRRNGTQGKSKSSSPHSWEILTDWLDDQKHEAIETVAINPGGPSDASAEFGLDLTGCLLVGTTSSRLVQLRRHVANQDQLVPLWATRPRRHMRWGGVGPVISQAKGSVHILPHGVVIVLQPWTKADSPMDVPSPFTMWAIDLATGAVLGEWELPRGTQWQSLCGGGDNTLWLLGRETGLDEPSDEAASGPSALWRLPLPHELRRPSGRPIPS